MQKTTGTTISRLGALTVMLNNQVPQEELSAGDRIRFKAEVEAILKGERGPDTQKVAVRSAQRCAAGGALISVQGVGIFGAN